MLVWDIAVRVFHWSLVAGVLVAWFTGGTSSRFHELSGFVVSGLLVFRLVWGVVGTPHARFADFVRSPAAVGRYLWDIVRNRARRYVGHNPAGGYMILWLLALIAVISVTGMMQLTRQYFGIAWVENLHHHAANVLMLLIPLHLLGVVLSSWMHQENLVGAMLTGVKTNEPDGAQGAVLPTAADQLGMRLHASHGFTVLMFLLAGSLFVGWNSTENRTTTTVVETPQTPAVAVLTQAIQDGASAQAKERQDYVAGGPEDASQTWLISSGGRLYDNWYAALGKKGPMETHPSWPAANTTIAGDATWRCKSCHGWDYNGRDGQYQSGSYATGIIGVQRMRGRDPDAIISLLGNATHRYTDERLPQHAKYRLALFISRGQHTASQYVLPNTKVKGDAAAGKPIFQSICASCHGFDGRARKLGVSSDNSDSGYKGSPLFVGTKASTGPVEVLHKLRNGHPGAIMVSMRPFSIEVAANLLAYAQTLPTK